MSEHELFVARNRYRSRVFHSRFRRENLKAEKKRRIVRKILKGCDNYLK